MPSFGRPNEFDQTSLPKESNQVTTPKGIVFAKPINPSILIFNNFLFIVSIRSNELISTRKVYLNKTYIILVSLNSQAFFFLD